MQFAITLNTNLSRTPAALAELPSVTATANILWSDELAAGPFRTVDSVSGRVLDEFLVPVLFEGPVKKLFHMFQGDDVCGAAFGWHVLGVRDGELEASLEARVAHPVAALQLGHLAGGELIHTNDTIIPDLVSLRQARLGRTSDLQFDRLGWGLMMRVPVV